MARVLVVGGGVAGPAVAMFLQRSGHDVEIVEADPEPDAYGGLFLNVATNGLAVLESLDLRERMVGDGHRSPHMIMWSRTGKQLGTVPNGPAGDPERGSVVVRRGWLHQVLREGATSAGIPITYGARLVSIEETAAGVRAVLADGQQREAELLVGCDGIGSPTRTWIDPQAPTPTYSGLVGLGGFARVDGLDPTPETQHFVFGARSFFGYLVRADGTVYWFANLTRPNPDRRALRAVPREQWLAELTDLHADDPYPVPQILAGAYGPVGGYPIDDLTHVPHWSRGRVVLVGDAVHATSPSAGQGASLALEDAATLARCLAESIDHSAAFAAYQRVRQPRAERVVAYARAINQQKRVTRSRLGVAVRDALLPLFLRRAANDTRNRWLYDFTVDGTGATSG